MVLLSLLFTLLVCFGLPLGGMAAVKRRFHGRWSVFLVGALAFFISQICLRIPLLTLVLPRFAWFGVLQLNVWQYGLFLGATAALFEEGARWIGLMLIKRRGGSLGPECGLAFGLGHGGAEAILLVGVNALALLGLFLAGSTAQGFPTAGGIFLGGAERLFTILFHTGCTLLIAYGLRAGQGGRWFVLAFALHTLTDAGVVILPAAFGMNMIALEAVIAVFGMATFAAGIFVYRKNAAQKKI